MISASRLLCLSALVALSGCRACGPSNVVARVDGAPLTADDLSETVSRRSSRLGPDHAAALDVLVERELLARGALRQGLDARPQVQARLKAAAREVLAEALLAEASPSLDESALRKRYEVEAPSLTVRQVDAAHLFFALPQPATEEQRRATLSRATTAWGRLVGGEEFEAVARELSEDSATASLGGHLGLVEEGRVDEALFAALAELKPGTFSKPTETSFGVYVVKALGPVQTRTPTFEQVRGRLAATATREAREALLKRLKSELTVERVLSVDGGVSGERQ